MGGVSDPGDADAHRPLTTEPHEKRPPERSPRAVPFRSGDRIRTCDLWVMSYAPRFARDAPPSQTCSSEGLRRPTHSTDCHLVCLVTQSLFPNLFPNSELAAVFRLMDFRDANPSRRRPERNDGLSVVVIEKYESVRQLAVEEVGAACERRLHCIPEVVLRFHDARNVPDFDLRMIGPFERRVQQREQIPAVSIQHVARGFDF